MKSETVRQNFRQELVSARMKRTIYFKCWRPRLLHMRPIAERHRIVFYLGHLETFDWNMICKWAFEMSPFNPAFDQLFAFGIDPVDGKLPQDKPSDWPAMDEILSYRDRIRRTIDAVLETADLEDPSKRRIFHVVLEHRWMHAETLAYMLHWLDFDLKRTEETMAPGEITRLKSTSSRNSFRSCDTRTEDGREFGWDNEIQAHSVFVPEFSIDAFNVTNAGLSRIRYRRWISGTIPLDSRSLGLAAANRNFLSEVLDSRKWRLVLHDDVREDPFAAGLAGVRESCRSLRICTWNGNHFRRKPSTIVPRLVHMAEAMKAT